MAAVTFDTLKFANRLKEAGVSPKQAEAEAEVLAEALQVNLKDLATERDLLAVRDELKSELRDLDTRIRGRFDALEAKMEGRFLLLQWMIGLVMTGVLVLILKAFF
jgi:hypothetical protein